MSAVSKAIRKVYGVSVKVNAVISEGLGILVLLAVLLVVLDVILRFTLSRTLWGATEMETVMLAFMFFVSYSYGLVFRNHVRVGLVFEKFPRRVGQAAEVVAGAAAAFLMYMMTRGGFRLFWSSFSIGEKMPAAVNFPFWLAKSALPIGCGVMFVQAVIYTLYYLDAFITGGEK